MLSLEIGGKIINIRTIMFEPDNNTSMRHAYVIIDKDIEKIYRMLKDYVGRKVSVKVMLNKRQIEHCNFGVKRVNIQYDDIIRKQVLFIDFEY